MYKVFINDKIICFTKNGEDFNKYSNVLVLNFFEVRNAQTVVNLLIRDEKLDKIIIVVEDIKKAFMQFQGCFQIIKAAGGIVSNIEGKQLFIYRLNKWDLPKGKIEEGEKIEEAAIREIEEECGISNIIIGKKLEDTFHMYKLNDQMVFKQTYWFEMRSNFEGELIPQIEEEITKVEWLNKNEIKEKVVKNTYSSIVELLNTSGYL